MFSKYIVTAGAIALMAGPAFAQAQRPNYDTNGDGKVTVAEYVDASVARSLERLDTNKDGTIQASERAGMPGGGGGGGGGGGQGGPGGGRGFGAGGLAGADANNDGNITKAELTASVQARAKTMDANSDGVLEASEMTFGRGGRGGPGGPGGGGRGGPGGGGFGGGQ